MINIEKIKVNLPEDVLPTGEISLVGNIATLTVVGTTTGDKEISVSYDGKLPVSTVLHVTDEMLFEEFILEPAGKCYTGDIITCTARFSNVPLMSDFDLVAPYGFEVIEPPHVEDVRIIAKYKAPNTPMYNAIFTANYRSNTAVKIAKMAVEDRPAEFLGLLAGDDSIRVGQEVMVMAQFNKAPNVSDLVITSSNGLMGKMQPEVMDTSIVLSYTGMEVGPQFVTVTFNGVTHTAHIEVVADAVIESVKVDPETIAIGESSVITVKYDKPRLLDQPEMDVRFDNGLEVRREYQENPDLTGGVVIVTGVDQGEKTITFTLNENKPKIVILMIKGIEV